MKLIKKILLPLMIMLMAMPQLNAADQEKGKRPSREQFAKTQANAIAEKLALDETAAAKFIDLFTACQKEIWGCAPRYPRGKKSDSKTLTEDEARKIIAERFAHNRQIGEIKERYYGEYSKFLTQRQILRIYHLEKKMMDRMFHERMKGNTPRHGHGRPTPPPPPCAD